MRSYNDADGPHWKHSLFGNPNDHETFRSEWFLSVLVLVRVSLVFYDIKETNYFTARSNFFCLVFSYICISCSNNNRA